MPLLEWPTQLAAIRGGDTEYETGNSTKSDMQKTIISLLEKWQRQRERNRRDER